MINMGNADGRDFPPLSHVLKQLEDTRDMLVKTNTQNGNLARYHAMKQEIQQIGWSGICAKYHPDVNINDPAAHELFQLYKFVYTTMDKTLK